MTGAAFGPESDLVRVSLVTLNGEIFAVWSILCMDARGVYSHHAGSSVCGPLSTDEIARIRAQPTRYLGDWVGRTVLYRLQAGLEENLGTFPVPL